VSASDKDLGMCQHGIFAACCRQCPGTCETGACGPDVECLFEKAELNYGKKLFKEFGDEGGKVNAFHLAEQTISELRLDDAVRKQLIERLKGPSSGAQAFAKWMAVYEKMKVSN